MELARRGAAPADDDGRMPISSHHAQMTMDALRQELLNESIRQEVIAAELRELDAGFWRDVPLRVRAASRVPAHSGASTPRRSVTDRIERWYRPPWHRTTDEEHASSDGARLHTKALSGVKRKRTAETSWWICSTCKAKCARESDVQSHLRGRRHQENIEATRRAELSDEKAPELAEKNQKLVSRWKCTICKANCSSESDLESHLRGRRHQENIEATRRAELSDEKALELAEKNQKLVSRWKCTICKANCSSESDLESHLRGRRHQENIEATRRAELSNEKAPELAEKNQKLVSRWKCTICKANCSSESDLESHLRGRRHQENIEATRRAELSDEKAPKLAEKNQKLVSRWKCTICKANCSSESDLESHLRGRRHQWNVQAQC